jgi:membrane associated rhomboid family serine protease
MEADFAALVSKNERVGSNQHKAREFDGVFGLLCANFAFFTLDHLLGFSWMRQLYLHQSSPAIHQFLTSIFCHSSYTHLSSNLFFIFVFGRIVEEKRGPWGLVAVFLTCGVCANIVTLMTVWDGGVSGGT